GRGVTLPCVLVGPDSPLGSVFPANRDVPAVRARRKARAQDPLAASPPPTSFSGRSRQRQFFDPSTKDAPAAMLSTGCAPSGSERTWQRANATSRAMPHKLRAQSAPCRRRWFLFRVILDRHLD